MTERQVSVGLPSRSPASRHSRAEGDGKSALVMHRTALFSRDRRYRYRLGRRWGDGAAVCFILLNPSTADETREDPTVRRCIGFARGLGYGALEVVNLYAYVATDPAELRRAGYPVGRYNDRHIEAAVRECQRVVLAWGVHAARFGRPAEVLGLLGRMGVEPHCLRLTAGGHPEHPLRLPLGCGLVGWLGAPAKRKSCPAPVPADLLSRACGLQQVKGAGRLPSC